MLNKFMPFAMWCQKVLPLVYDDSLSYYEVICKLMDSVNKVIESNLEIMEALSELGGDTSLETDYVTPEMFGGIGDGIADDTDALQSAIDSGKNVMLSMNKMYNIRRTIHLNAVPFDSEKRNRISRTIFSRAETNYNNSNASITCKFATADFPVFAIDAPNWTFDNVNINALNQSSGNRELVLFKTNLEEVDVDFNLVNCFISNAKQLIDFTGRGFLMQNCKTYAISNLIDIKWKYESEALFHNDTTGQRAIRIIGNRFHSNANNMANTGFITLTSGNGYCLEFTDNCIDRGRSRFLRCLTTPYGWNISNNLLVGLWGNATPGEDSLFTFEKGAENCIISNNRIVQSGEDDRWFRTVIFFGAGYNVKSCIITDNNVDNLRDGNFIIAPRGEDVHSAILYGCVVNNNAVELISEMSSRRAIIYGQNFEMHECSVCGNTVGGYTTASGAGSDVKPFGVFIAHTTGNIYNCKIIGNAIKDNPESLGYSGNVVLTKVNSITDGDLLTVI